MCKHQDSTVDACRIDNHEITSIHLETAGSVTLSTSVEVIAIMIQCAGHGKNKTMHSSPQIENHKNTVDEKSIKVGGGKHVTTLDNCKLPMSIRNALPYVPLRPCADK